jgi:hypothetical protein
MAFGQSTGPSASGRQVKDLLELLINAGHADFRDARGPMGFTQRQAGGKFTVDEAAEFIDQLQTAEYEASKSAAPEKRPTAKTTTKAKVGAPSASLGEAERALRTASTKSLVLEVRRRGWIVTKPE